MVSIMKRASASKQRCAAREIEARAKSAKDTYPDFALLRRGIFGDRKARKTGTDLVAGGR
jgi:hypothetical protein